MIRKESDLATIEVKVELAFETWLDSKDRDVYYTEVGQEELALGDLHVGTLFDATLCIHLEADTSDELRKAMAAGYQPVFRIVKTREAK